MWEDSEVAWKFFWFEKFVWRLKEAFELITFVFSTFTNNLITQNIEQIE